MIGFNVISTKGTNKYYLSWDTIELITYHMLSDRCKRQQTL